MARPRKDVAKASNSLDNEWLSDYQRWYWKNPNHPRALQRAKYKRYPEKIYAMNRAWQKKNWEHYKMLCRFGNQIHAAKKAGDMAKVQQLKAARFEYKRSRHVEFKHKERTDA